MASIHNQQDVMVNLEQAESLQLPSLVIVSDSDCGSNLLPFSVSIYKLPDPEDKDGWHELSAFLIAKFIDSPALFVSTTKNPHLASDVQSYALSRARELFIRANPPR